MAKLEYTDYDYLSKDEAEYQGYDTDDNPDIEYGLSVKETEWDEESDGTEESDGSDYPDDQEEILPAEDGLPADDEGWNHPDEDRTDEDDADPSETEENDQSDESYVLNGRKYKDPRQYILALYKADVTAQPKLDADEQIALARIIRRGMLCDCSIMPDDPKVPDEYPYKLVDTTLKVARRLNPSEEEKKWLESLTGNEKKQFIADGRAAQEKLISCTLPLVMSIVAKEHNGLEYLDNVQAGNIGLMKAAQYFNPSRGVKFITFATILIRNEIRNQAKYLKKQASGFREWENYVATEDEIDRLYDLMGGRLWMREITVDTDQTEDRIRKQIAILLERKIRMESIAGDRIFRTRDNYDAVLADAEMAYTELGQPESVNIDGSGEAAPASKRKKLDIITGDGSEPKDNEMSIEDYVRKFFGMVYALKSIPSGELASFVLKERNFLRKKSEMLRSYLKNPPPYTEKEAIADLESLIRIGNIWPERALIEQVRKWGYIQPCCDRKIHHTDDDHRMEFSVYLDCDYPTESIALILSEGYIPLRQQDILEHAHITLEYCDWLCEIIDLTARERLTDFDRKILEELASKSTYKMIQEKYETYADKVHLRSQEVLLSIYDQIIESSNKGNGNVWMKYLLLRYRSQALSEWERTIINRIESDHFVEKVPFALRSRGEKDAPRPVMETFFKTIDMVDRNVRIVVGNIQEIQTAIRESIHKVTEFLASEEFEHIRQEWSEYEEGTAEYDDA